MKCRKKGKKDFQKFHINFVKNVLRKVLFFGVEVGCEESKLQCIRDHMGSETVGHLVTHASFPYNERKTNTPIV